MDPSLRALAGEDDGPVTGSPPLVHAGERIQTWLAQHGSSTWLPTDLRHIATWTTSPREDLIRSGTTLWESVQRDRWGLPPPRRRILVVEPGQPVETSSDWSALRPIDVFHAYAGRKLERSYDPVERSWGPDGRCRNRELAGVAVAMHERHTLPVRGRRITVQIDVSMTDRAARLSFEGRTTLLWLSVDQELDRNPTRTWSAAVFGSYALYRRAVLPRTAALPLRNRLPEAGAFQRYLHDLDDLPSVSRQPHERRRRVADAIAHLPTFVAKAKAANHPDLDDALAPIEHFLPEDSDFPGHAACRAADLAFVRGDRVALERIVTDNLETWESSSIHDTGFAVRQRANLALLSGQPDVVEAIVIGAIRDRGRRLLRLASCASLHIATGTRSEPIDTAAEFDELCRELERVRTPPHWIDCAREFHWTHALLAWM